LRGEAGCKEHLVKKIARTVAGEHAAGSIGAVRSRREANEKKLGFGIAEAWHWFRPIIPIAVSTALHASHFRAILHQARAFFAGDDFVLQDFESVQPLRLDDERVRLDDDPVN